MSMPQVMTVTGPVPADELGIVLPHEHLLIDTTTEYRADGLLHDEHLTARELAWFRELGGTTIVDLTTTEIGRNPAGLQRIAQATGVTIVMACGHYRDPYLDRAWFDQHSVDDIAAGMIHEATHGVDGTGIRPGIIGEIGADRAWISAAEERSLRAAARAHHATGLTISTHAARWPVGRAQLAILREEGVPPHRVIIGHCDSVPDHEYHLELAAAGCYVELDNIGTGTPLDDEIALRYLLALRTSGHLRQILLSHDVFLRSHLKAHGGNGYTHLLQDFRTSLANAGLGDDELHTLLRDNPRDALIGRADETSSITPPITPEDHT
jgi:phosphotriesterase-related protein